MRKTKINYSDTYKKVATAESCGTTYFLKTLTGPNPHPNLAPYMSTYMKDGHEVVLCEGDDLNELKTRSDQMLEMWKNRSERALGLCCPTCGSSLTVTEAVAILNAQRKI